MKKTAPKLLRKNTSTIVKPSTGMAHSSKVMLLGQMKGYQNINVIFVDPEKEFKQ